ncbi:MAG: hypothetical protein ACRDIC_20820, partial [bacterium]
SVCVCGDAEVVEERLHADAEGLVIAIDAGPGGGLATLPWASHPRDDGTDDLLAQGGGGAVMMPAASPETW